MFTRILLSKFNYNYVRAFTHPSIYNYVKAAKIPEIWEIDEYAYVEMNNALTGCYTCRMFGELLRDNLNIVNDFHLSYAMVQMKNYELEPDQHFYDLMVPILSSYIPKFTREHNRALARIIGASGYLKVNNDSLWKLYEEKLIKERLYRYIPLSELVDMTYNVAQSSFASKEFYKIMEQQFVMHKKALTEEQRKLCLDAFKMQNYTSPLLENLTQQQKVLQ